jgi:hypothetical protein
LAFALGKGLSSVVGLITVRPTDKRGLRVVVNSFG